MNILDEYTRECLGALVERTFKSEDVLDQLFNLFVFRAVPEPIRSDNEPELTAKAFRKSLTELE